MGGLVGLARPALAEAPPPVDRPAEPRLNQIQADLGAAILGVAYERTLAPWVSLRFAAQFVKPWYTKSDGAYGVGGELRPFYFPWGKAPLGPYLSPFARIDRVTVKPEGLPEASGLGGSAGLTVGYTFGLGEAFLLRLGAGAQLWAFRVSTGGTRAGLGGIVQDLDIVVGYRF